MEVIIFKLPGPPWPSSTARGDAQLDETDEVEEGEGDKKDGGTEDSWFHDSGKHAFKRIHEVQTKDKEYYTVIADAR